MALGLPLPSIYVVPPNLFDRRRGLTLAEIEFPSYYNFFVLKRRARLVVESEETADRLRTMMRESLFASRRPTNHDEFAPSVPMEARPDFARETDHFRRGPDGSCRDVDDLVEFCVMGPFGAVLDNRLRISKVAGPGSVPSYAIEVDGSEIFRTPATVDIPDRVTPSSARVSAFDPPAFGLTVLGASHGFDPAGKTTGFLLWIGRRGLLIDPPVDTMHHLREAGVMPKIIDGVILTHCHADHDSGVFAKLLEEGRTRLYTTPTILASFLRKYSSLSGITEQALRDTFSFRPLRIGQATPVNGAELFFFYTLHSIPTVGFEVYYGGKSLVFSADTCYDPPRIEDMVKAGTITRERADALIRFPWHHTVVLHEAGVPPLHTPTTVLAALPPDVKKRLYLLHIADKDLQAAVDKQTLPPDHMLKVAPVGVENTIRIPVDPPRHADAIALLDVFVGLDLFRGFSLARAREILQVARSREYQAGQRIIAQNSPGDAFYVIMSGVAAVKREGVELKRYQAGDYFGETALILSQARNADVFAHTDCVLVEIDRYDFMYLLRGTDIAERLVRLARMREERSWELFSCNSALQTLTSAQKTQLQSYLEVVEVKPDDRLWTVGTPAEHAFLIDHGRVILEGYATVALAPFSQGAFLGEIDALVSRKPTTGAARVVEGGRVFRIARGDLLRWFEENPGVYLGFLGTRAVE